MIENWFFTASLLLILASALLVIAALIMDIRKKDSKILRRLYLIGFSAAVICLVIGTCANDLSMLFVGMSVLCMLAALILFLNCLIRRFRKKDRRRLRIAAAICVAVSIGLLIGSTSIMNARLFGKKGMDAYEVHIQADYDFEVVDGTEPLAVITSNGFQEGSYLASPYRYVYDHCDLPLLLEDCPATVEQCLEAIRSNTSLGREYQMYFSDFVQRIGDAYPEADLSILYHNLQTLRVVELDQMDYIVKSFSIDSYGCYVRPENTIYIPKGTEYIEGEWGFQVLIHEFCHAARTVWAEEEDGGKIRIQYCSGYNNTLLEESMNSVFSCSLLNYDERDIAYQVPSNYLRIMLECMDNYELSDYFNHSECYFLSKLDEYTGHTNYAQVMWKLITLQRSDWERDTIDIPAEEYEPIYAYLCDMYYGKYITPDMTQQEREAVAAELVDRAFFDAPEGYKLNEQFFFDYLDTIG